MNEFQPKITVVTPSFNQGCLSKEAIESVVNQRFSNVEHLIIDGGSSDQTLNILKHGTAAPDGDT